MEDRTISLRNLRHNAVESKTEYREIEKHKIGETIRVISEAEYKEKLAEQEKGKETSVATVHIKGKEGMDLLPGMENSSRYEEHRKSGITGSLGISNGTISAGVGYEKSIDRLKETAVDVVRNKLNVSGDVVLKSETGEINFMPTEGTIGGKLIFDSNGNPINILDVQSERRIDRYSEKSTVGIGVSAGIPAVGAIQNLYNAGKNLGRSKHTEDYINSGSQVLNAGAGFLSAYGELFTSPLSTGVSLNYSKSKTR